MDTQSTIAIVEINELPIAINLSKGNLTRFEYPKLARFYQTQEEFAEVHGLIQSGKLWKHLSDGDLPKSKRLIVFDTPKHKGSKIFLNMVKPQFVDECRLLFYRVYQESPKNNEIYLKFATCFVYEKCSAAKSDPEAHKIAWALFARNVILSLKRNPVAWKRKVDAFRDTHGPINVITTGDSMPRHSMQADVKGMPEPCFMPSMIKKLCVKILGIQSNNKAKVLKNELKEKKSEFLNKRDALIRRETTASAASMIQTKITSLQTRYGSVKGANATDEQLAAVEAQITAMSNAVKLIEGDDKIANMKIDVESIELGCNERIIETVKSMLVGHNPRASPYFQEPTVSNVKTKVSGWSDAEAAHHMSFETGRGYTENAVGVEEGNVFYLGIASLGGAKKSWSDRKAAKNLGHDTVPLESTPLNQLYLVQHLRRT
ncbi:hypothetical protein L7F22_049887 [Adiantum nelumboides]|nr:hypothetical protein [Adiantum nelumboides]